MKLSKSERQALKNKYDVRCAYCGTELPERWHADHFKPVVRELKSQKTSTGSYRVVTGKPLEPQNDVIENMMPACPPCNISKGSQSIESWRTWLAGHVNSLNWYHPIYRISKAFGLISETGNPVKFHFEKLTEQGKS